MATEKKKSYAAKNEERIERAVDNLEDRLTGGEDKKPDAKSKDSKNK